MEYDIFISYRRVGGAQYARILQLMLNQRGYNTFLDYDELTDGIFSERIKSAIQNSKVYILVLSSGVLERCKNEDDWLRQEILWAVEQNKHIIHVNPDNSFDGIPDDIPEIIKNVVSTIQHSDISFGQTLGISVDFMIEKRIVPTIGIRTPNKSFKRCNLNNSFNFFKLIITSLSILLVFFFVFISIKDRATFKSCLSYTGYKSYVRSAKFPFLHKKTAQKILQQFDSLLLEKAPNGKYMNWSEDITIEQLKTVNQIMNNIVMVSGGTFLQGATPSSNGEYCDNVDVELETPQIVNQLNTFYMCKNEVSVSEWCEVLGIEYDPSESNLPVTDVSFDECKDYVVKLSNLTGIQFRLPTEAEWEYAARGGINHDDTHFAGRNEADEVAWYSKNSGGRSHSIYDNTLGLYCNSLDLYNMSGNVSEWCDTPFRLYSDLITDSDTPMIIDVDAMVIRGGNYESEEYELTVSHRTPMNRYDKLPTVGCRLVMDN